ncbi:ABC transporter substrate-binding protein [Propylenella binzhouense]|uniref:ABC transporter substrate-binding protein n=1 Tax=Propylenella binzhouense TaxID=2555902 RepID=A0A964T376_9HYPH|nr:ABC transporter substrate-binding protein [Propylenella binzhouense]MYZ47633.1 ABC transporter substrate-binding protein [Propylenella binzhouense]
MNSGRRFGALLGALAALWLAPLPGGEASAQTKEITVVLPNPSALNVWPMHVAIGEGYMREEGLNVTVQAVDGSSQVLQAMAAGQAQIGLPGPAPVLAARERGEDVVFIYNLNPKSIFGIVVRDESDYQKPADLKGKVIGVGTADGAEVGFARAILADAGMEEGKDYTFLPVGDGGTAAAAFERGDIEGYAAATSDAAIMTTRGLKLREITPEPFKAFFGNGFAVLRSYMTENPQVIEGFGRALVRGTKFGMDPANREKVLAHAKTGNPQEGEDTALANALLDQLLVKMDIGDQAEGYGYQPPANWETWQETLIASDGLKEKQDLSKAFTNEFVEVWNKDG